MADITTDTKAGRASVDYPPMCLPQGKDKPKTNVELIKFYMERGSPINQLFLIDALNKLADRVTANKDAVREAFKGGFVSAEAWIRAAEDFKSLWEQCTRD